MMKSPNSTHQSTEQRRKHAEARQEHWGKLSPQQQLEALDARLGKDRGAVRQRARLQTAIVEAAKPPVVDSKKKRQRRRKGSDDTSSGDFTVGQE